MNHCFSLDHVDLCCDVISVRFINHQTTIATRCRSTLLWVQISTRKVIADSLLLDQDGRGGNSDQPVMDFLQAEKDL